MSDDVWPFADPGDTAVFTSKFVIEDEETITYVSHDADDGAWQFHSETGSADLDDARLVALKRICALDPTVLLLADLPLGWRAWRASKDAEWVREKAEG